MTSDDGKLDRKLDDIEKELIAIESKVDKIEEIVNQLLKKIDNRYITLIKLFFGNRGLFFQWEDLSK